MPDSVPHPRIQRPSQFNLRSMFALTSCLAVGLACGIEPSASIEGGRDLLYFFHEILFPSASAAVCIGLIQQAIFLSRPPVFKRQFFFAIGWRIVVTALLILCLFVDILVVRDFAVLPEGGNRLAVYYGLFFPELLQYACLLVVFGEYRHRLLLMAKGTPLRLGKFATLWVAATLLVLLLLPNHQLVHFLVYIAMGGIEAHQPLLYQRLGTYPDHHAEGFWFFYLSFAAVTSRASTIPIPNQSNQLP